jgi:endo-1,4-beta-xylanase
MKIKSHLAAVVTLAVLAGACALSAQTLRQAAKKIGLLVGTAAQPRRLSDAKYAGTLTRQFNMIEAENSMKWRATEPAEGVFDFKPGDRIVAFAEAHGMQVRGHNLLWGKYNPAWLAKGHFTPSQLRHIMKRHIQTVVRHYRGKVFAWDVVNEAFDSHGHLRHTLWYDRPGIGLAGRGTDYIAQAFRWAHQADPHALLFYNDYAAEGIDAKSDAIYAMVKDFKRCGVPIDGVGLQMHVYSMKDAQANVAANIARLTKLGVEVQITEMDVGIPTNAHGQASKSQLAWQAKVYRKVAMACAENPGCTAFQTWGFTDRYSWIPKHSHGKEGAALLFDASYRPKPAFDEVLGAFEQALKSNPRLKQQRLRFERRVQNAAR